MPTISFSREGPQQCTDGSTARKSSAAELALSLPTIIRRACNAARLRKASCCKSTPNNHPPANRSAAELATSSPTITPPRGAMRPDKPQASSFLDAPKARPPADSRAAQCNTHCSPDETSRAARSNAAHLRSPTYCAHLQQVLFK